MPTEPPLPALTVSQTADDMLMVDFGAHPQANHQVRAFWQLLQDQQGLQRLKPVAGMQCVGFFLDPTHASPQDIEALTSQLLELASASLQLQPKAGKRVEVPVCYDTSLAPDLEPLAKHAGLTIAQVIERHSGATYVAELIGFLPGFAYLGGLEPTLATPRLPSPRPKVPPGSLGIAGMQCAVYPTSSPGGWNLIGRSPMRFFNPHDDAPCRIQLGDEVHFIPISLKEFERQWASR